MSAVFWMKTSAFRMRANGGIWNFQLISKPWPNYDSKSAVKVIISKTSELILYFLIC